MKDGSVIIPLKIRGEIVGKAVIGPDGEIDISAPPNELGVLIREMALANLISGVSLTTINIPAIPVSEEEK